MAIHDAVAIPERGAPFERMKVESREPSPSDVLIRIEYSGICHSDLHTAREDWGPAIFPLVPGHEIVGVVQEVGSDVRDLAPGTRVGVGCMVDSCGHCVNCLDGEEQFCLEGFVATYNSIGKDGLATYGGYSTHVVVNRSFVLTIPPTLSPAAAAPLLCAGITTYSPLVRAGVTTGTRVAVLGLGGLGHVAVKLARALGAEVTILSQDENKRADAAALGADHFVCTGNQESLSGLGCTFDLIINTASAPIPVDEYLALLRRHGRLVNVGAPPQPMPVSVASLIYMGRSWGGSMIGGIRQTQEMLDFCAGHGIEADIELISASEIEDAYARLDAKDVRYRFVIDGSTF